MLNAICGQIFGHIFSNVLNAEERHDFSKGNNTLTDKLTHLLYHLKEQKKNIIIILSDESNDLFLRYFKAYLKQLFADYESPSFAAIPKDFVLNHYVNSFSEALKWRTGNGMEISPEKVVEYYMALTK